MRDQVKQWLTPSSVVAGGIVAIFWQQRINTSTIVHQVILSVLLCGIFGLLAVLVN